MCVGVSSIAKVGEAVVVENYISLRSEAEKVLDALGVYAKREGSPDMTKAEFAIRSKWDYGIVRLQGVRWNTVQLADIRRFAREALMEVHRKGFVDADALYDRLFPGHKEATPVKVAKAPRPVKVPAGRGGYSNMPLAAKGKG